MVCLANQRNVGETAVWAELWHSQQLLTLLLSPTAAPASFRLGILPPTPACRSAISRSVRPAWRTGPGAFKEIQSSEEALIHHTSPAACHLNAKYFHCISKSKQEKKMSTGGEWLDGIKAYKGTIESAGQTLCFLITFIFGDEGERRN